MVHRQHSLALLMLGICSSILLLGSSLDLRKHSHRTPNHEISIIFDMNGVLVKNGKETKILGISKFIPYALMHGFSCKKRLKQKMYEFYESIEARTPDQANACDHDGILLPQLMCEWMRGTQTPAQILHKVETEAATRKPGLELDLISSIANMIFTPELFVQTQHWVDEALDFVKELKSHGYKLYILSNFDSYSFAILKQQHPKVFTLFDGVLISGDVGMLKPQPAIYEYLLETHGIDRSKAFFIDDQIVNVQAARDQKIASALCIPKKGVFSYSLDKNNIRTQFINWRTKLNSSISAIA